MLYEECIGGEECVVAVCVFLCWLDTHWTTTICQTRCNETYIRKNNSTNYCMALELVLCARRNVRDQDALIDISINRLHLRNENKNEFQTNTQSIDQCFI